LFTTKPQPAIRRPFTWINLGKTSRLSVPGSDQAPADLLCRTNSPYIFRARCSHVPRFLPTTATATMPSTHAEPILSDPTLKAILPSSFLYACSSASYQIEGGFEADGKGVGIWDEYMKAKEDNGEVACDSYNLWKEDVKLLKEYGCNSYRFSIAWPRIIPNGMSHFLLLQSNAKLMNRCQRGRSQ